MKIKTFCAFQFPQNCYAAIFDAGIFLVDPGEFTLELENFVNEAKYIGKKRFRDETDLKRCISDFIRWNQVGSDKIFGDVLGGDLRFRDLRNAYMKDDIESAITFLARLKFNMLKDGDARYNEYIDLITHILELAHFDETELSSYDEFKYANNEIDEDDNSVAHSKFDFMKEAVRQFFDKMDKNDLPGLSEEDINDYDENDYNSEKKQIRRYFGTILDLDYNNIHTLEIRLFTNDIIEHGFYYTLEDIKEICNVIIGEFGKQSLVPILKEILDVKRVLDKKLPLSFRGKKLPLAVAVNGKVLAGMAYYNPIFDMYTETEEQMKYLIDKFKKSNIYEILTDYFENLPDVSEYELVDLEKINRG